MTARLDQFSQTVNQSNLQNTSICMRYFMAENETENDDGIILHVSTQRQLYVYATVGCDCEGLPSFSWSLQLSQNIYLISVKEENAAICISICMIHNSENNNGIKDYNYQTTARMRRINKWPNNILRTTTQLCISIWSDNIRPNNRLKT